MWTYVNVVMSNSDSHVVAPNLDKGRRTECWGCDHYFG